MAKLIYKMPVFGSHPGTANDRSAKLTRPYLDGEIVIAGAYGQKAQTCWYYVSKMILKFHKETERATDDTYKEYRALHELRKVLTELWVEFEMTRLKTIDDLKSLQYLNALASQDQSEKLVEVDMSTVPTYKSPGKSGAIAALKSKLQTIRNSGTSLLGMSQLIAMETDLVPPAAPKALPANEHEAAKEAAKREEAILQAIDSLEKLDTDRLNRRQLLEKFFPSNCFTYARTDVWKLDEPEELHSVLDTWGPFYAGGYFSAKALEKKVDGFVFGTETRDLYEIKAFKESGRHAIAVCGVDTSAIPPKVYYVDPNASHAACSVPFADFANSLKPKKGADEDEADALVITSNCFDPKTGECAHKKENLLVREKL